MSRRTIIELGHDQTRISRWVGDGQLIRLLPSWYALAGDMAPPWQPLMAATAYLHGLQPDSPVRVGGMAALVTAGLDRPMPHCPLVLVADGRRVRLSGEPFLTRQVLRAETTKWDPRRLPISGIPDAVAEVLLEQDLSDPQLRSLVYEAVNQLPVTPSELVRSWAAGRSSHHRRLRHLASDGFLQHESPAERDTFLQILSRQPPAPDCQVLLTPRIRVDYVFLFAALVLEYHGRETHRDRVDEDASRSFELNELGYETLPVTSSMRRQPARLLAYVHERRITREALALEGKLRRPPLPPQPDRVVPLRTLLPSPEVAFTS